METGSNVALKPAECVAEEVSSRPLSESEQKAWDYLVERGRKIKADRVAAKGERRMPDYLRKGSRSNSMSDIPVRAKRWVVSRVAGLSFTKAAAASGADWITVQECRARSEEFRAAYEAYEQNSRDLMLAKARSIVESSQDEGSKVSMAQTQVSMRILSSLDREHFADDRSRGPTAAEEVRKAIGGGFVINLIADASKVADRAPDKKPSKALVYADV